LRDQIERFIEVGAPKFVVVPVDEPAGDRVAEHLADLADAVLPLQS
jgi:hypothetical protein